MEDLTTLQITSERLVLRPFKLKDQEDCFAFFSDKECCFNGGGYEPFEEMDEEYQLLMNKLNQPSLRKMIALKDSDKVIGTISLEIINQNTIEIGYTLAPSYWHLGYASEAVESVCEYLFNHTKYQRVIAGVIKQNKASIRLLERLNFKYYKTEIKAFKHPIYNKCDLLYFQKSK